MNRFRLSVGLLLGITAALSTGQMFGQITINELVDDEQDYRSVDIVPDTREFVELYNAGESAVDISGWTLNTVRLTSGATATADALPTGSTVALNGYFVIGKAGVPNVNYSPVRTELWENNNLIFELRNPAAASSLIDAIGIQTSRGPGLYYPTQVEVDQISAGQTARPPGADPDQPGPPGGWFGLLESNNALAPNVPLSLGRYLNGRDTNRNGFDFGLQPLTPGASNNLPLVAKHTVPNVDSLPVGTLLGANYAASYALPQVIDPTVVSAFNPNAIAASPQGGKAIIAYDNTGGGSSVYSKELVKKFDIYAYIDPRALHVTTADNAPQSEAAIYGIGTTDPMFSTPNSAGLLTGLPGGNIAGSINGSTGLGWMIQRREKYNGGSPVTNTVLQLLDMNDGGDGVQTPGRADWQVEQTIDLTGLTAGWHRLSIEYDPATGNVAAMYDASTFTFTTTPGLVGNFYVGWRESLPGANNAAARPPTFDLYAAPADLAGDFNNDGKVDGGDYAVWEKNLGTSNALTNDGGLGVPVGASLYELWRSHFGNPAGSGSELSATAVPEPGTIGLALIGGLSALAGRRRGLAKPRAAGEPWR